MLNEKRFELLVKDKIRTIYNAAGALWDDCEELVYSNYQTEQIEYIKTLPTLHFMTQARMSIQKLNQNFHELNSLFNLVENGDKGE